MNGCPRTPSGFGRAIAGRRAIALAACVVGALSACAREAASEEPASAAPGVVHVRVQGQLDVGNQALLSRAIRAARSAGDAPTLVIELDTPGGQLDVLWTIQKQLLDASKDGIRLVTWVHDHAISAGALVALTSDRIYMSSAGTIGDAMPVTVGPLGMAELPEGVREKQVSFLRAQFAGMAEEHGRPKALAIAMVDQDAGVRQIKVDNEVRLVTHDEWDSLRETGADVELVRTVLPRGKLLALTAREAVELRLADGLADDLGQVLERLGIDPQTQIAPVLERSRSETFVAWLDTLKPLLLLMGLVLGYVELKMPGFGLPGILSLACFVLLLVGQYLAGLAEIPHIVAVAVGAALIAVEVFAAPGTLWFGIAGLVLVFGGLLFGSLGPGFDITNPLDQSIVIDAAATLLVTSTIAVVAAFLLSRWLPKVPGGRRLVLSPSPSTSTFAGAMPEALAPNSSAARVGAMGRAVSALRPVGKVVLDGAEGYEWEARSAGELVASGARVRVVEVSAARLVVELAEPPAAKDAADSAEERA